MCYKRFLVQLRQSFSNETITLDGSKMLGPRSMFGGNDRPAVLYDANGNEFDVVQATVRKRIVDPFSRLDYVGSGAFATVYNIDDDYVLKVTNDAGMRHGYGEFVRLSLANQHNPHFPRIKYAGQMHGKWVFVLERLYHGRSSSNAHTFAQLFGIYQEIPQYLRLDDPMKECFDLLIGSRLTRDVYDSNVLERADGTAVITDPMFNR